MSEEMAKERQELQEQIEQLLERQDIDSLQAALSDARSADVAEIVEVLPEESRRLIFDALEPHEAGEVLEKIDEATRAQLVEQLPSEKLTDIVATMPPDEAADVIAAIGEEKTQEVLEQIDREDSEEIKKLLDYEEDSGGGIMTSELIQAPYAGTVRDAIHALRQSDPEEEFYFVFVTDEKGVYKGAVSAQALLRHPRATPLAEVMDVDIPTIPINTDQEEIATIFRKNDLIAAPVLDENGVLVGRITADDIVDVMDEEAEEDVLVMAGTSPEELGTHRSLRAATVRLPWLLICMVSSLFSAMLLYPFFMPHFSLTNWVVILMFVPAIAAMGGNSGMQTAVVVVRGIATGDLAALRFAQVVIRELKVAFLVAITCAVVAGSVVGAWLTWFPLPQEAGATATTVHSGDSQDANAPFDRHEAPAFALSVGVAMFSAIMLSSLWALLLPFLFRMIGIDPAISCGPLVTTTNDIISFITYFSLAMFMLRLFEH